MPAIVNRNGGMQRRLAAVGDAIADGFEQFTVGFGLDLGAAQVGGQGVKTLAHRALAVVFVAMTLGTICQIHGLAPGCDSRLTTIQRGIKIGAGCCAVDGFSTADRNKTLFHYQQWLFMGPDRRSFPHTAIAEVIVIIHQRFIGDEKDNANYNNKAKYFFHLFNTLKRKRFQMQWIFFFAQLTSNMLGIGQRMIWI
jgi:hypothetical protein